MQGKLVILSGLVFSGALAINSGIVWSQTGSGGSAGQGKSGSEGTGMQKPTDPPSGTSRGKSGDSLGAPSGRSSGEMGSQTGARGMSGQRSKEEIKQVQEALKDKGHDPGMADGVMGPKTQQAIRAFQKKNDIQATGRLDEKTASALGVDKSDASSGSDKSSSPSGASSTERKGSSPSGAGSSSGSGSSTGSGSSSGKSSSGQAK